MLMTYLPHIVIWAVLTAVVVMLAIYRRRIDSRVDETLHVLDAEAPMISTQADVSKKLAVVDRWGKILTVVAVLYLLGIAAAYIYTSFSDTSIKLG
jgi:phosphoglycerol transferase MdoB-like AlkP superfamily enzyme